MALADTLLLPSGREAAGREARGARHSPSAGVIDSQSVNTTEGVLPRGYDEDQKIKGRKRPLVTDTDGSPVYAAIHTADVQDRDGARLVLTEILRPPPRLWHVFADGCYAGDRFP